MPILALPVTSIIDVPTARILARDDAGTGPAEALTNLQLFAILGTGTPSASTYLRGDGAWATVSAGISSLNGLTAATQTFAVGTTGTDVAFVSASGTHTLNIPNASATARGVVSTGTQTFAGAKTFASVATSAGTQNARSLMLDGLAAGGFGPWGYLNGWSWMNSSGTVARVGVNGYLTNSLGAYNWGNAFGDTATTSLFEDAPNRIGQRRGVNAQAHGVYNTHTSDTSFERLSVSWASNVCYIGTEKGSAGGTARDLTIGTDGVVRAVFPAATTSGAFYLGSRADNTATGGNARGSGAVDLQTTRTAATQVASGTGAVNLGPARATASGTNSFVFGADASSSGSRSIAFGDFCRATNFASIAIGINSNATGNQGIAIGAGAGSVASGANSVAIGSEALSNRDRMYAYASGSFAGTEGAGDAQFVRWVLRNRTTDGTTAVTLFANGVSTRCLLSSGRVLHATICILGSRSDANDVAVYMRQVAIKNVSGTTSLVGTVNTIGADTAAGTSIAITADDTNDALQIAVTGVASQTWRWVAVVEGVELVYGT